ncbi:hypothetical protein [Brevundimonas diminuta]|uniref:hypothetical protein n=1 Tax=Brevundimonas diminuta TaxID=293 RepID=UPI0025A5F60F|nr:hypothetical protein [Brevundimonas diminuta]MDM8352855.1 hypothetical protein [Brevundimonas diminuta]
MNRLWSQEEVTWGRECYAAGDSAEDVAAGAGCSVEEVVANIGPGRLTDLQREVVSLYLAGASFAAIDIETGRTGCRVLGKASAGLITTLRKRGHPLPHRNALQEGAAA